jgi:very-short-patch-repair endonuclease
VREGDSDRSGRPWSVDGNSCRQSTTHPIDEAIFELARRQHDALERSQLIRLGLAPAAIDYRVKIGRLQVRHRGVYGLGPAHSKLSHWMAAVLAAGPDAVLSHRSAAQLWGLVSGAGGPLHLTAPSKRSRPAILLHRSNVPDDERTEVDGIPVTSVPRTILDCAPTMTERQLERLINEADVLRLYDHISIPTLLHRYPRRPGSRKLWVALGKRNAGSTRTRSDLEELLIELVDELGLRRPETNVILVIDGETFEIDALWRAERVAVELDSREFHLTPLAFERDRRRDRKLSAAGWRPVRITWRQITAERAAVGRDLTAMLATRRGRSLRVALAG